VRDRDPFDALYPNWTPEQWYHYGASLDEDPASRYIELEKCKRSCAYWLFHPLKYVWTKDEFSMSETIKPFPREIALWDVLNEVHANNIVFIGKSRQLMITWLMCAYFCWWARFYGGQLLFIQSKKEEDAANLVFNKEPGSARIDFIETHLPWWMQDQKGPKPAYGQRLYANGSKIWGIPQGSDTIRSYTGSGLFSDEAAFQPFFLQAYRAAKPSCRKIVAVSSAEPSEFGRMGGFMTDPTSSYAFAS